MAPPPYYLWIVQVLMDQLWCYIYTYANTPGFGLMGLPGEGDIALMRRLLKTLHTHGVDWTDPSAWPEDCVNGRWERQIPIPFLLEHGGPGGESSLAIIQGICEGRSALLARC